MYEKSNEQFSGMWNKSHRRKVTKEIFKISRDVKSFVEIHTRRANKEVLILALCMSK